MERRNDKENKEKALHLATAVYLFLSMHETLCQGRP